MPKPSSVLSSVQPARVGRVVRGLLTAESRPRYLAAARRRVHQVTAPPARQAAPEPSAPRPVRVDGTCSVCLSQEVGFQQVTYHKNQKSFLVQICRDCGYIANPDNFNDYTEYKSLDQFPVSARVGTEERPGREYHMAKMGTEILGTKGLSVMIVGPGRSVDYQHIKKLAKVKTVRIGDVVELHDQPDFINVLKETTARFDLVILSEVIEHFTDPGNDFPRLFRLLKKGGIVICSTNIYDGGDLSKHNYLYIKGHTSYYTPKAIEKLAADNQMFFDFRVPVAATTFAGPRKRYVLFTNSPKRLGDIARYFGSHTYAPSEK